MNKIKISVMMSVYHADNPLFFREALQSIFNQTLLPDEVILVVDGKVSSETEGIIKEFETSNNIKTTWVEKNMGHGHARRIGLDRCNNELVAVMDSDDICVSNRFEKQVECFIENERLSAVGSSISEFINDTSNVIGKRVLPTKDYEIKEYLKMRCPFNHMTVMFRKSEVMRAGGYQDWYHNEDYYLWIRMYLKGSLFFNKEDVLVYARTNEDFYRRRGGWKYFLSEFKLQKFMYSNKINSLFTYWNNVIVRLIVQLLLPNYLREKVFIKFFRQ
jgi:glycosyltransferase involved in cell wall biosynthesis